jgi:stage III sporulation protein AA
MRNKVLILERIISLDDLKFCINIASRYSPWSVQSVSAGYVTAYGGHRIGICGQAAVQSAHILDFQAITSLCIRVARDFENISGDLYLVNKSILIIGRPCSGKTTLLRDLIRQKSNKCNGAIAVVDERNEIFPYANGQLLFPVGKQTDVLGGVGKQCGIESLIRNMSPYYIAVDEITSELDCAALLKAGWCGVNLIATAHAGSYRDLQQRPIYQSIIECKLFPCIVVMHDDKSWHIEGDSEL